MGLSMKIRQSPSDIDPLHPRLKIFGILVVVLFCFVFFLIPIIPTEGHKTLQKSSINVENHCIYLL